MIWLAGMKIKALFLLFLVLFINNCSNQNTNIKNIKQGDSYIDQVQVDNDENIKLTHLFQAANKYIDGKLYNKADALLSALDQSSFNKEQLCKYNLMQSKYNFEILKLQNALSFLNKINVGTIQKNKDDLASYYKLKYHINYALNKTEDAVAAQIKYVNYIDSSSGLDVIKDNNKQIWDGLVKLSKSQMLNLKRQYSNDSQMQGWLEIALIFNSEERSMPSNNNSVEIHNKLNNWYNSNPNHAAVKFFNVGSYKKSNNLNSSSKPYKVNKIVLLLPTSGKYKSIAESIKMGFLSAYYNNINNNNVSISIIDSASNYDINSIDADVIVGPLIKSEVNKVIKDKKNNQTKVLALNYTETGSNDSVFQFGISAEDEAEQVSARLNNLGYKNVLVITEKSSWGDRVYKAFKSKQDELNNNVIDTGLMDDSLNYQEKIRKLLGIDNSNFRKYKLSQILGAKFIHVPQRRNDIDSIFLALPANQAKQVVPLLKYFYAGDIPVFAISSVFNEKTFDNNNNDLNNVQFCDIPGNLPENITNNEFNYKQYLTEQMSKSMIKNRRLFALGMDAYNLSLKLYDIEQMPFMVINGMTGKLNLSDDNKIKRNLPWAKIKKSKVINIS